MSDSPYKLFDYYTYEDRHVFFGREEESLRMVGEILSTRLLVLFAPSGSGKSSLINAGVRPLLEDRGFRTIYVRMETDPATAIRQALSADLPALGAGLPTPPEPPTEGLLGSGKPTVAEVARSETGHSAPAETAPNGAPELTGQSAALGLHEFLRQTLQPNVENQTVRPLVIFLDQFEEFFTVYRDQPQMRQDFIRELAAIRYDTSLPVFFVLSLRDDYFVNLNEFREAIPSIFQNNANIQLWPLDDLAAERAIVNPARAAGYEFEEGLAQRIIADLKPLNPDGDGVLPITLQIACHNLWLAKDGGESRISAAQYDQLGGARIIIDQQLNRSLAQIPRRYGRLMRRLFRVLMTADLTKRLRSAEDLAELLGVRPASQRSWSSRAVQGMATVLPLSTPNRLESLLGVLTDAGILRAEYRQGAAWYEFRHDYLVGQVASWVNGVEQRLVRRQRFLFWIMLLVFAGVTLAWMVKTIVDFNTYVVSFRPHRAYAAQQEELWITRKFDPFADHVTTSLYRADLRDHVADNRMREGFVLPLGQPLAWESFADLFRDGKPATFQQNAGLTPDAVKSWLLEESIGLAVAYAEQEPATVTALLAALKDNDQEVRSRAAAVLGQLGHADADVVAALVQAVKDRELYLRSFVKEKIIESGIEDRALTETLTGPFALLVAVLSPSQFSANETAALVRLGRDDPAPVATALVTALRQSDSPFVRVSAAKVLGQISRAPPSTVAALVEALKDSEERVRDVATQALGHLAREDRMVVTALVGALKDLDPSVRRSASEALRHSGGVERSLVTALVEALNDKDSFVQSRAAAALGELGGTGSEVVTALIEVLKGNDSSLVRSSAAAAMGRLGRPEFAVVTALVEALKDNDASVRSSVAAAMGQLGRTEPALVTALVGTLKDMDSSVRQSAARALGHSGCAEPAVVTALVETLKDNDPSVRMGAAAALGQLGRAELAVITALVQMLKGSESYVRSSAADALGKLGRAEPAVVTALIEALKDKEASVRSSAAAATGRLGRAEPVVVTALLEALKDKDTSVRSSAAASLGQLGRAARAVVTALIEALKDKDASVQSSAATSLGQLARAEPAVVTALVEALKDNAPFVRSGAAKAARELVCVESAVLVALSQALKDNASEVRRNAAVSLGTLAQERSDWTDERMLELLQDNDSGQRDLAGIVLAYREKLSPAVVEQIRKLRKDDRPWVRMAALYALAGIEDVRFQRAQEAKAKSAPDKPAAR